MQDTSKIIVCLAGCRSYVKMVPRQPAKRQTRQKRYLIFLISRLMNNSQEM